MRTQVRSGARALCLGLILAISGTQPLVAAQGTTDEIDDDLADAGVISETEWESPQFGTEVTWDGDWEVLDSTLSDPDVSKDTLELGTDSDFLIVTLVESADETPAEYFARLLELREDGVENFELLDENEADDFVAFTMLGTSDDRPFAFVGEVRYLNEADDLLILIQLTSWTEDVADAFDDAQDNITIDGDELFEQYTTDTLPELDVEPEPSSDEADAPNLEDLGVIAEGEYVSPQFDTEATWTSRWEVVETNLYSNEETLVDNIELTDPKANSFQLSLLVSNDETPEEYVERLLEARNDADDSGEVEIIGQGDVEDRSFVIYITTIQDTVTYVYSEIGYYDEDDEVLIKTEIFAEPDSAQSVFDRVQKDIEIDGDPPFLNEADLPDAD